MWYVYILRSLKDKRYYIGCTSNLKRRINDHNAGYTVSTKYRTPFEIIHVEEYNTQREAYAREKTIKSYKGGQEFKKLLRIKV